MNPRAKPRINLTPVYWHAKFPDGKTRAFQMPQSIKPEIGKTLYLDRECTPSGEDEWFDILAVDQINKVLELSFDLCT